MIEFSNQKENTFDQLCINYSNERFQQYFVELMLGREKIWCDSQGLNIPFVPFLDNGQIIGMLYNYIIFSLYVWKQYICILYYWNLDLFDNKSIGIFSLLDDECKFRNPSVKNFACKLKSSWITPKMVPINWNNPRQKSDDTFLIRHFTSDVHYATVRPLFKILNDKLCFLKGDYKSIKDIKCYLKCWYLTYEHLIRKKFERKNHSTSTVYDKCINSNNTVFLYWKW